MRARHLFAAAACALAACLGGTRPALAATYADMRAAGVIKVAVYHDFAPFSDGRQHTAGIDVDLAQALADKLGLKLSLLPFDSGESLGDDLRNMVWKGHYLGYGPADVMLHVPVDPALAAENPRVTIFAPYYRESIMLGVQGARVPQVANLADLKDKHLCAVKGEAGASALIGAHGGSLAPQVQIVNDVRECAKRLREGSVDAIAARRAELEAALNGVDGLRLYPVESPVVPPRGWIVGMAIRKGENEFGEALAKALDALRSSGELDAIFRRHHVSFVSP